MVTKAVILAGGRGTRLSEETHLKPKPMIEIGGQPIIWHIMKLYSTFGVNEFIICLGYKGYIIKEYFANYALHTSDLTIDLRSNEMTVHRSSTEPWKITLVETGDETQTGGRLKRVQPYVGDEDFCFTYGDGVADINITELIEFHYGHPRLATISAVKPPGRFGALAIQDNRLTQFQEKPDGDGAWINGGYFVLSPKIFDFIQSDLDAWEDGPLNALTEMGEVEAFQHAGFWRPMDTLRDKHYLNDLWEQGRAPWKCWQ